MCCGDWHGNARLPVENTLPDLVGPWCGPMTSLTFSPLVGGITVEDGRLLLL